MSKVCCCCSSPQGHSLSHQTCPVQERTSIEENNIKQNFPIQSLNTDNQHQKFGLKTINNFLSSQGRVIVSGILLLWAFIWSRFFIQPNIRVLPLAIPVLVVLSVIIGGYPTFVKALQSLLRKEADTNLLMSIAVIGAMAIGEWFEAGTVVILFAIANGLESLSMEKVKKAVRNLMNLAPPTATLEKDGKTLSVSPYEVKIGDIILIRPGEGVPLDGVVTEGESYLNQSPITGESYPVRKKYGDPVYAGSINEKGFLRIRVTHGFKDSTLARIVEMTEQAQSRQASFKLTVDRFAKYYTPLVVTISLMVFLMPVIIFNQPLHHWLYRALTLLLISCPCAFVISTPVSFISALTSSARNGILIKGGKYLEALAGIRAIAFDKTGTITKGKLSVSNIFPLNGYTKDKILQYAYSVEYFSEHPLAKAIVDKALSQNIPRLNVSDFNSATGKGVTANIGLEVGDGRSDVSKTGVSEQVGIEVREKKGDTFQIRVGSHRIAEEIEVNQNNKKEIDNIINKIQSGGSSSVLVYVDGEPIGIIEIADSMRDNMKETLSSLKNQGIEKIVMLTGDNNKTARYIADKLDIDYKAELLPQNKVHELNNLISEYKEVVFVGDGINDAPAIATARVGIAMGSIGSHTALETAPVALMSDDLSKLPFLLGLSRQTLNIVKQNIFIALSIKLLFLLFTVMGWSSLWMAVFADTGTSLLVIFNAMRLWRFNYNKIY